MLARDQRVSAQELLASACRKLTVLEALFKAASFDPDGHPFSGPSVPDLCLGVAENLRDVISMLGEVRAGEP